MRFNVVTHLPPGSADGQTAIEDSQSDNGDIRVFVDPQEILTDENRQKLAERLARALNGPRTIFAPEYP